MSKAQILKHKNQTGKITRKRLLMLFLIIVHYLDFDLMHNLKIQILRFLHIHNLERP